MEIQIRRIASHRAWVIRTARESLDRIKNYIKQHGERPIEKDQIVLGGEVLFNMRTLHGSGDWFILQPAWIWYVKNNGTDRDDWIQNNIRTNGAGAIGWRLPRTDVFVNALRSLQLLTGSPVPSTVQERQLLAEVFKTRLFTH